METIHMVIISKILFYLFPRLYSMSEEWQTAFVPSNKQKENLIFNKKIPKVEAMHGSDPIVCFHDNPCIKRIWLNGAFFTLINSIEVNRYKSEAH